jgi:hypothetical protein
MATSDAKFIKADGSRRRCGEISLTPSKADGLQTLERAQRSRVIADLLAYLRDRLSARDLVCEQ